MSEDPHQYLIEYYAGREKGDFYKEPVEEALQIGRLKARLTVDLSWGIGLHFYLARNFYDLISL